MLAETIDSFGSVTRQLIDETRNRGIAVVAAASVVAILNIFAFMSLVFVRIRTKADPMDVVETDKRSQQIILISLICGCIAIVCLVIISCQIGNVVSPTLSVFSKFGKAVSVQ